MKKTIIYLLVCMLFLQGHCLAAEPTIQSVWGMYLKEYYNKAINYCEKLERKRKYKEEALYIKGLSFLKKGDGSAAVRVF